jgi:hypothetical protein
MPLNIRSRVVNQLAERLGAGRQTSKTDAVRIALENELRRLDEAVPLRIASVGVALRQGTRASGATQPWRLHCLRNGKERSDGIAVQGRRFQQDRHPPRRAVALKFEERQLVDHDHVGRDHQVGGAFGSGMSLEGGARGSFMLGDQHQTLATARVGLADDP